MTAGRNAVSHTKDWCTPPVIVRSVKAVFGGSIHLDPCSNQFSLVGAETSYELPYTDGLMESWDYPTIYVNPPYGTDPTRKTRIIHWFARIAEAANNGSEIIALVPVATNTAHWKQYVYPCATALCFLYEPRVRFYIEGREDIKGAPMSCAIIYYGKHFSRFADEFKLHGVVIPLKDAVLPQTADIVQIKKMHSTPQGFLVA